MITQQHNNEIQQKAQASSPVKQHRWISVLLCILGIALPLIAGSMVNWPWGVAEIFDLEPTSTMVLLSMAVLVTIGATLLYLVFRAWWAVLFAPVAWLIGEFLGAVVRSLIEGGWLALQAQEHFWDIQSTIIFIAIWPFIICAFFGAGIGLMISWKLGSRKLLD